MVCKQTTMVSSSRWKFHPDHPQGIQVSKNAILRHLFNTLILKIPPSVASPSSISGGHPPLPRQASVTPSPPIADPSNKTGGPAALAQHYNYKTTTLTPRGVVPQLNTPWGVPRS